MNIIFERPTLNRTTDKENIALIDKWIADTVDKLNLDPELGNSEDVPTKLSELEDDSTHRTVTDAEKASWNNKPSSTNTYQTTDTTATSIDDADYVPFLSTSGKRKITLTNIKAKLKTYFDTVYAAISHTHTKSEITDFPTLGTAASKDVPTSGNASTSQVVMGNDTRLSDARTPTAHTHADKVSVAGDTMTGTLTFNQVSNAINYVGTNATTSMIRFKDNTADPYGNGVLIGGGGLTVVGCGESADTYSASIPAGSELLYLTSDSHAYIVTGVNYGVANAKTFVFGEEGEFNTPGPIYQNNVALDKLFFYSVWRTSVTCSAGTKVRIPASGTNSHIKSSNCLVIPIAEKVTRGESAQGVPCKYRSIQTFNGYCEIVVGNALSGHSIGVAVLDLSNGSYA